MFVASLSSFCLFCFITCVASLIEEHVGVNVWFYWWWISSWRWGAPRWRRIQKCPLVKRVASVRAQLWAPGMWYITTNVSFRVICFAFASICSGDTHITKDTLTLRHRAWQEAGMGGGKKWGGNWRSRGGREKKEWDSVFILLRLQVGFLWPDDTRPPHTHTHSTSSSSLSPPLRYFSTS